MPAFRTRFEDLPESFPVFPLSGALLLPHGKLPLNIFEPRYLAMVEDALAAGRVFGMVQPDDTKPPTTTGAATYRIGCLGRLSSFSETEDGRYLITLTGLIRFSTVEELPVQRGYRRIRADFAGFADDLAPEEGERLTAAGFDRVALIAALRGYFTQRGLDANWDAIKQMPDGPLVHTLAMVCPFAPPEKQALLEAATPADRAATLLALLQINAHEAAPDGASGRSRAI